MTLEAQGGLHTLQVVVPLDGASTVIREALKELRPMAISLTESTAQAIRDGNAGHANYKAQQVVVVIGHILDALQEQTNIDRKISTQGEEKHGNEV